MGRPIHFASVRRPPGSGSEEVATPPARVIPFAWSTSAKTVVA